MRIGFLAISFVMFSPLAQGQTSAQNKGLELWEKTCKAVKNAALPQSDQPKKDQLNSLKNCDSESLYYGIGKTVDFAKARLCAYAERKSGDEIVFGGSAVLMMIYANGLGVKKNIPLAEKFACDVSGTSAEIEERLARLEELSTDSEKSSRFDLCDNTASGLMKGLCTVHAERLTAKPAVKEH